VLSGVLLPLRGEAAGAVVAGWWRRYLPPP
jgi:hypothetical protein